jgi:hypothetical protein
MRAYWQRIHGPAQHATIPNGINWLVLAAINAINEEFAGQPMPTRGYGRSQIEIQIKARSDQLLAGTRYKLTPARRIHFTGVLELELYELIIEQDDVPF